MKTMKKALTLLLIATMVLALSVSAFAAGETTSVTISSANSETGSVYKGYMIMTAVPDNAASPTKYTYTVNPTYKSAVVSALSLTGTASDLDIYTKIAALDADGIEAFADTMYNSLKTLTADATLNEGTAASLAYGYWLIYESTAGTLTDGSDGTYTKVLLDTYAQSPAVTVTTKESVPTVEKKVDSADATSVEVGSTLTFTLTATLPTNIAKYADNGYKLVFTDTMSAGLTFGSISSVTVNGTAAQSTNSAAANYYTSVTTPSGTDTVLTVTFNNILGALDSAAIAALAGKDVVVTYTATVNDSAVVGSAGNSNEVTITYSNDPYTTGTGDSVPDEVDVYTYQLDVSKVDGSNAALTGADFTLYITTDSGATWTEVTAYNSSITKTGDTTGSAFSWTKLPAGSYKLVETTVPAGYTKADDVEFTITPVFTGNALSSITTSNTDVADDGDGTVSTTIQNISGTALPSTGGIGTTIFYIVGGILIIGAVVVLITRRRMGEEK